MKKRTTRRVQARLPRGAFYPLLVLAICMIPFALAQRDATKPSVTHLRDLAWTLVSHTTLTFAERVSYQRSIEEVYWRHRIWPKERPDPKPSLDAVMSQAQLEEKVAGYMRNSQAFEGYYHRPITADELETEMDRIAKYSKQPNVLRELFEALGNDPFVIAECLARPVLAERLLPRSIVHEARQTIRAVTQTVATTAKYTLPLIQDTEGGCSNDTWTATSTVNAPTARAFHTAVWTGIELIIWGGQNSVNVFSTGSLYNPTTDSRTATTTVNAPSARSNHTAVWTGSEMIVWGGNTENTGGRYNPATNTWTATSTTNVPIARDFHTAVWAGSEMIIWGGIDDMGFSLNRVGGTILRATVGCRRLQPTYLMLELLTPPYGLEAR